MFFNNKYSRLLSKNIQLKQILKEFVKFSKTYLFVYVGKCSFISYC